MEVNLKPKEITIMISTSVGLASMEMLKEKKL